MKKNLPGVIFWVVIALIAYFVCKYDFFKTINLNSLTLAIIVGMLIGNLFLRFIPRSLRYGIT